MATDADYRCLHVLRPDQHHVGLPPFGAFYSKSFDDSGRGKARATSGLPHQAMAGALVGAIYYTRILKTLVLEQRPADFARCCGRRSLRHEGGHAGIGHADRRFRLLRPNSLMPVILPVAGLCHAMPQNAPADCGSDECQLANLCHLPGIRRHPAGHLLRQAQNGRLDERGRSADHRSNGLPYPAAISTRFPTAFALIVPLVGAINMTTPWAACRTATASGAFTAPLPACAAAL